MRRITATRCGQAAVAEWEEHAQPRHELNAAPFLQCICASCKERNALCRVCHVSACTRMRITTLCLRMRSGAARSPRGVRGLRRAPHRFRTDDSEGRICRVGVFQHVLERNAVPPLHPRQQHPRRQRSRRLPSNRRLLTRMQRHPPHCVRCPPAPAMLPYSAWSARSA